MAVRTEARTATIIAFPASARLAERMVREDRWAALEREAAGVCDAASGAWYHADAVRDAESSRNH